MGAGGFVAAAGAALALPAGFTDVPVQSPHVTSYEFFGRAVASLGTQLVVGAPGSSIGQLGSLPGHIYVMSIDGTFSARHPESERDPSPATGSARRLPSTGSGTILVGAPFDDTLATNAGAAYLFDGVKLARPPDPRGPRIGGRTRNAAVRSRRSAAPRS